MKNYFEIFGFLPQFEIDLKELEKKYLKLQHQFHPDQSSLDDISKSIEINEGYKTLSNDFLRACYLLKLQGINIIEDEKAAKVDFSTLAEILELQEKILELSDKDEIEKLKTQINNEIKTLIDSFSNHFKDNQINSATQFLIKAKYLKKSLEDLKRKKTKI